MRRPFIGGNWKMHGDLTLLTELANKIKQCSHVSHTDAVIDLAVFPSFVYLSAIGELLTQTNVQLGAQNHADHEAGAFTGEVSPAMVKEMGCDCVLLGHSERRGIYQESSETVAQKVALALKQGLTPVLCVGETLEAREDDRTEQVILAQLEAVINQIVDQNLDKLIIAYEPVWAIGTGKTATPDQAQAVHQFIRQTVAPHSSSAGTKIRIIYGGSVKPHNARDIFAQPDVDGGLIGGASLKADDFAAICAAAVQVIKES